MSILKHHIGGSHFELLVKSENVRLFRQGKLGWAKCLVSDEIWKNSKKGDRPSDTELSDAFGANKSTESMIKTMLTDGDLHLSASERKKMVIQKTNAIVQHLHRYYLAPNGFPHPETRINNALAQVKFHVDPVKDVHDQVQSLLKLMPGILSLKKVELSATLTVDNKLIGPIMGGIKQYASFNGSPNYTATQCIMKLSIIPGDLSGLFAYLGKKIGDDNYILKIAGQDSIDGTTSTASSSENSSRKHKKKKKKSTKYNERHNTNIAPQFQDTSSSPDTTATSSTSKHGKKKPNTAAPKHGKKKKGKGRK